MKALKFQIAYFICKHLQAPAFIIRVDKDGNISVNGNVKAGFVNDCKEIVERNGVSSAFIYGTGGGREKGSLKFSGDMEMEAKQQIRNAWQFA